MKRVCLFIIVIGTVLLMIACGVVGESVDISSDSRIVLDMPGNGVTDVATACVLRWAFFDPQNESGKKSDSAVKFYKVFFKENSGNIDYPEQPSTTLQTEFQLPELKKGTSYKWRIDAVMEDDEVIRSEERTFETINEEIGAFKLVNSWGVGFSGENIPDGYYWMTYAALKNNIRYVYVLDKQYTPTKAVAVFKINHPMRSDCNISIGVGDVNDPDKLLNFSGHFMETFTGSGSHPFPDHSLIFDITDLLPVNNRNIFLQMYDEKGNEQTGNIEAFSVEIYETYDSAIIYTYAAQDLPIETVNGQSVYSVIPNLNIPLSIPRALGSSPLSRQSNDLMEAEYLAMKRVVGTAGKDESCNAGYDGYGTGYRPPTEAEWSALYQNNSLKKITPYTTDRRTSQVDHSKSKYFPPVGSQGSKGACSSWATVYYTGTFYNAKRYDWDLSMAEWDGKPSKAFQDRILSPDFVYLQLNEGENRGTSIFDNFKIMHLIGTSSWETCPYDVDNFTQWPSEKAWRDAPKNRLNWMPDWEFTSPNIYPWFYLDLSSEDAVQTMKNLLADGYLMSLAIQADCYEQLSDNDVWNTLNYATTTSNHANTIVGYDDSLR